MGSADTVLASSKNVLVKRGGFSLIEAAIVLGVIGLVIGGIWVAANSVRENMIVSQTMSGILTSIENMKKLVPVDQADTSYGTFDTFLVNAAIVPKDWILDSGQHLVTPSGLLMTFLVNGGSVYINFAATRSLCIKLLSAWASAKPDHIGQANGTTISANTNQSLSWITGACTASDPPSVYFRYILAR